MTHSENRISRTAGPVSRLRSFSFVAPMDRFLTSPGYLFLIGALTVLAFTCSLEIPVYAVFILIGLYVSFFGKDYLPIVPIVVCSYIAPSIKNNPGKFESSIFFGTSGAIVMSMGFLFALSLILRLALDPEIGQKKFFKTKRKLLSGILLLGAAYLLAGAGSGHYFDHGWKGVLFGFLQFASVFLLYYILCGAVKWNQVPRDFFAWSGVCIGCVLLLELLHIYIAQSVITDGAINRDLIFTGWGHYNNLGALLTMMIPFAFYFVISRKNGWIYNGIALLFALGVVMTCSRASIMMTLVIYLLCGITVALKARSRSTKLITILGTVCIAAVLALVFHNRLEGLFYRLTHVGGDSANARLNGYKAAVAQFLDYPLLGGTFFPLNFDLYEWSSVDAFTSFFPPRWHNTILQVAASCGVVGLAAYAFHRVQTAALVVKKPDRATLCTALAVLALLLTSLLDCHLFNIGPTLFYSMALAFIEKLPPETV